ncbi:hypothetical protein [Methylobacter luteus]|jgi:hypothetical protein|uniref:hypothetical protein n=1 Tax=Methylobacter luteus TaxID=415 RepID=UPI0003FFFFE9|nr:hypothetical protein [Methylobacter luteus]
MKKILLVLALAAFSSLSYADNNGKNDAKEHVNEAIEDILENNGKIPANETAKAVKELKLSVRDAVLNGLISRLEGSNALNGLENALKNGGGNPVSPS